MRERRKVAARADRTFGWDDRVNVSVEHLDERFNHDGTHAGKALGKRVRTNGHSGADYFFVERRADSGAVAEDEVAHQSCRLVGADGDVRKNAKAGVNSVNGRRAAREEIVNPSAAGVNARARVIAE